MWATLVGMPRTLLSVFFALLISFTFASSSSSNRNSLKRKRVEVESETENILAATKSFYSGSSSSSSTKSTTSTQPTQPTKPTEVYQQSRWVIGNHFDLHPTALPQLEDDILAYRALFNAIMRKDFDATFLILSVFPQLRLTRYIYEISSNLYMNYYHLASIIFPVEQFKTLVSFGNEADLVYPYSTGTSMFDSALKAKNREMIYYLRPIFIENHTKVVQLQESIKSRGIISLFIKDEL